MHDASGDGVCDGAVGIGGNTLEFVLGQRCSNPQPDCRCSQLQVPYFPTVSQPGAQRCHARPPEGMRQYARDRSWIARNVRQSQYASWR